tara:strand:- start:69 stop:611 length:543 start_codon:yes stop_codon:yes gene_type:complete
MSSFNIFNIVKLFLSLFLLYNIFSLIVLFSPINTKFYYKAWKFTPYNYKSLPTFQFGSNKNILPIGKIKTKKLYTVLTREETISSIDLDYWNYRNSKELYTLIKEKEAISSFDLEYWNYRINYGINNKLFNNDFGNNFYNAIVLSKNNKVFTRKLKRFFSTNLLKFSKERRILIIKKFKE